MGSTPTKVPTPTTANKMAWLCGRAAVVRCGAKFHYTTGPAILSRENRKKYLPEKKAKYWIYQTLKALEFMHKNGIFHRDIKPENILLLKNKVKLADLGSCKGIYSKPPFTEYISTRWYRSPECLLTDGYYNYKMDIWGLGCVFYEILTLEPLFPGDDEIDQVNKINYILGSPPNDLFQKFVKNSAHRNEFNFEYQKGVGINKYLNHVSPNIVDLIGKMLIYDPDLRPTARECLNHECFKEFVEQDLKSKITQTNIYQDSILMKSFNDSISKRNDESIQIINLNSNNNLNNIYNNSKTLKTKKEASIPNLNIINPKYNYNNILLPVLKLNNINEDSKGEDSFNNSSITKKNQDPNLRLPKIKEKNNNILDAVNFMNSNDFKKLKHNISNHSIDKVMSSAFTIYEKKQKVNIKKRINEVKKNYISPYSKKIIENNLII